MTWGIIISLSLNLQGTFLNWTNQSLSSQGWFSSLMQPQIFCNRQIMSHFLLSISIPIQSLPRKRGTSNNPVSQVPQQSTTSLAPGHLWFPSPLATWINSITSCLLVSYAHLSGLVYTYNTQTSRQIKIVKLWERQRALALQCLFQRKIFMVVWKQLSHANVDGVISLATA